MAFEKEILLRLKRKYSKDEEIGLLVNQLKKLEFENGVLKSELAESKYISNGKEIKIERLKQLESENKNLKSKIAKLEKEKEAIADNGYLKSKLYIEHQLIIQKYRLK